MLWLGESADEAPENHLESIPRLLWRQIWGRGLLPDNCGELGDQSDHELAIGAKRLEQSMAPTVQFRIVPAKDAADETLKRLREGRIRDVAFKLIEFPRREQALGRDRLAELADDGGLADTAMPRHQNEFSPSSCGDAVERRNKSVYLRLASIKLFRDQKSVRHIARADGEGVNSSVRLPRSQARAQIRFEARGGLKPILWRLCEQLQDDGLDRAGNPVDPLAWRRRRAGNVAMDPFQRIGCRERERSGDRLVKGDTAGVEIAARINRPVHAAGLLGRHVSQRSRNCFGRSRRLAWEVRRDAETRQPDRPGRIVDENIGRLDILVDETPPVESRQRSRQANG